jgi:hypothetical protein
MDSERAIASTNDVDFGRTHWSMVAAVRDGSTPEARRSLGELCRRYWVPAYVYTRRCGKSPGDAASLVQAFLSQLVTHLRTDDLRMTAGFRVYLQARLAEFLVKDGGNITSTDLLPEMQPPWPLGEIEQRQVEEHPAEASPDQALQRAFALEMLAIALARLKREAEHSGRAALFELVRPFLSREPTPNDYGVLASEMRSSTLAAVIAVKRLRQRFQELIDEELTQTVGSAQALATERHTLLSLVIPPSA